MALAAAVVGVLIAKNAGKKPTDASPAAVEPPAAAASAVPSPASEPATQSQSLPRLVDLGAGNASPAR